MKIEKKEIISIVERIYNSVTTKTGNLSNDIIAESIIFNDKTIIGFNDEIAINYPFNTGLQCAIKLTEFYKLLQKIKDDSFTLLIEKEELIIEAKNIDAGFSIIKDYTIPDIENIKDLDNWETLPENFIDAIQFCLFSASIDISDGILVALEIKDNHVRSTDNYRLTEYNLSNKIKTSFLLHQKFVSSVITHNPIKMVQTDSWLHFCDDKDGVLSVRKLSEGYPSLDEFFSIDEIESVTLPTSLKEILNRTRIFALDENNRGLITIIINKNEIVCTGEGKYGWIEETVKNENGYKDKDELKFIAEPDHLLQILDKTDTVVIGEGRLLFQNDNFKHLIVTLLTEGNS